MSELIQEYKAHVRDRDGATYVARAYGERRPDGTWAGWIAFQPVQRGGATIRTPQETSQPTRETLEYWASGLEAIYFEGALERAHRNSAGTRPTSTEARPKAT